MGFESLSRNHAAAHGCGSAFVRRMIRVGTGWRLHALVAESGRRASPRSWWSARAVPVQVRASAQCLSLQRGSNSLRGGVMAFLPRLLDRGSAGSSPAPGTHACLVATVSIPPWYGGVRVRFSGQAPCRCSAAVSASPCQGEGREFESRHLLARGCGSAVEHDIPNVVLAVQSRSAARMRWWWNFGRHASPRN